MLNVGEAAFTYSAAYIFTHLTKAKTICLLLVLHKMCDLKIFYVLFSVFLMFMSYVNHFELPCVYI